MTVFAKNSRNRSVKRAGAGGSLSSHFFTPAAYLKRKIKIMRQKPSFPQTTENYLAEYERIRRKMVLDMTSAKLADSISYNFIVQMIPHHTAAIEMSENILKYTKNRSLREIAQNIVTEQTKSIAAMRAVERQCLACKSSVGDLRSYQNEMDEIMRVMFAEMKYARQTGRVSCDFMWEMIPHHEGAVNMSKTTLRFRPCAGLVPILDAIIKSQERGIAQMRLLLRQASC